MGELLARDAQGRPFGGSRALLLLLVMSFTLQLTTVQKTEATNTQFRVNNTALALNMSGGIRFQEDLGNEAAVKILQSAKEFILTSFNLSQEKPVDLLTLFVDNTTRLTNIVGSDLPSQAQIHLSANYVETEYPEDTAALVFEITGVLIHEAAHIWQASNGSYGTDVEFTGIYEGVADYIRLTAEFPSRAWTRSAGGNWYDGYSTTAYFLEWIEDTHWPGFVNRLNVKMTDLWSSAFFQDLTGQSVDQLWKSYQAYLATSPAPITTFQINNTALALNTEGGIRFDTELGNENMLQVLSTAQSFILRSFNMSQEKDISDVTLYVENSTGVAFTTTVQGVPQIHLSANYVEDFAPGDQDSLSYEITGVLTHESTHVYQNSNGNYSVDPVFTGVIEGIADFIRLRSQYPAKDWVRQSGGTWYDGYSTTAFFFDWIDTTQVSGFVNQLNYKMANPWNVSFIEQIAGRSVDVLWQSYQSTFTS